MSNQLDRRIRQAMQRVVDESQPPPEVPAPRPTTPIERRQIPNWVAALVPAAILLVVVGGSALLFGMDDAGVGDVATPPTGIDVVVLQDTVPSVIAHVALATGGTPAPDFVGALAGDDAAGPLPLGTETAVPDSVRLDFLFELCWGPCFRDAHFMDPSGSGLGSGPYPADTAFHVRHGFVNDSDEPLGDGFDVVIYVTPMDEPGEDRGQAIGETYRYTPDYVVRGTAEQCGPTYGEQSGLQTCEWFVHEFAEGLPPGRHALWAVWEAPCSAWVDYGFTESCTDPDEVVSLFSSGVDSPFGPTPSYTDGNDSRLTPEELAERDQGPDGDFVGREIVADASEAAPTGGSPLPEFGAAIAADGGATPLPLGSVNTLPDSVRLDFLFEFCWGEPCFRDGHFMAPGDPLVGSGPFTSDTPFHVRHGFVNDGDGPLGAGFDVVLYVTALDQPGEFGGQQIGTTYRYTSDYVVRETSEACGPTYRTQQGPVTCDVYVHEFEDGLPEGRHALWAVWEAPCSAWVDYGFTKSCIDPDEVFGLFTSGFDSPFGSHEPSYTEASQAPRAR